MPDNFFDREDVQPTRWHSVAELPMPDGLDQPGNLDSLFAEVAELKDLEPNLEPDIPRGAKEFGRSLGAITEPWVSAEIPRRPWIARGYAMRGAVTVVSVGP